MIPEAPPRGGVGNPPVDDRARLERMADLLVWKVAANPYAAALRVVKEDGYRQSESSEVSRLRKKYAADRIRLERDAHRRKRLWIGRRLQRAKRPYLLAQDSRKWVLAPTIADEVDHDARIEDFDQRQKARIEAPEMRARAAGVESILAPLDELQALLRRAQSPAEIAKVEQAISRCLLLAAERMQDHARRWS